MAYSPSHTGPSTTAVERRTLDRTRVTPRPWAAGARVLTLASADALALVLAATLAFLLWASPVRQQEASLYLPLLPGLLLFLFGYYQADLYPGFGLGPVEMLRRYWLVTAGAFIAVAAVTFALKVPQVYSRVTFGLTFVFAVLLLPLARRAALVLVRDRAWWPEPVALAGTAAGTVRIREVLQRMPELGFRPVGMLLAGPPEAGWRESVLGTLDDAPEIAALGIRIALMDRDLESYDRLDWLRRFFPRVVVLRDYEDLPVEGVQICNLGGLLGLEYGNNLLRPHARWLKRGVDLTLGGFALVLALPVIALALVLVRASGPGPLFFWQLREGRFGQLFRVPKIRTMIPDADQRLQEHFKQNAELRAEWEAGYKLRVDPRLIPGLGRWLRRFSIDELPQLWSVVKGEMSLVGPRPFPHYHLQAISARSLDLRRQVRPGLTGMWQVVARGVADVKAQEAHDSHYIRNWSLWLDLYILGKTMAAVLSGRGAY